MTTQSEYARHATSALHEMVLMAPDFDAERAEAVIERAIRNATRERDKRARQQLQEAQAVAQERLARLLSASPAVIYSFKATGDFAPTFVSNTGPFGVAEAQPDQAGASALATRVLGDAHPPDATAGSRS